MSKKTASQKTVATATVETCALSAVEVQSALVSALEARVQHARATNQDELARKLTRIQKDFSQESFLTVIQGLSDLEYSFNQLVSDLAVTDRNAVNHIAIYSLQKIARLMRAIVSQNAALIDGYTSAIAKNIVKLSSLTFSDCLAAVSSKVTRARDTKVKRFHDCGANTATTQSTSSKHALAALNLVSANRNVRNDTITLNNNKMVERLRSLYLDAV
jgi:hypothetical protein